jgi:hypothetical protein
VRCRVALYDSHELEADAVDVLLDYDKLTFTYYICLLFVDRSLSCGFAW